MGKKPKKPGKGKEKTERKQAKAEEKKIRRENKKASEEDDIDAILAKILKEEEKKTAILVEENVPPPSPRCNCSVTLNPTKENELIFYGGEFFNGSKTYVYGDLYRYNIEKNVFNLISSPNSPPPRSAHQAVGFKNYIYIFGGEFTSPNQERFHHYKDLWRFDLNTNAWENLILKNSPSPRSGHRMIVYKHKLILFGGFYDTLREVKYFNDLHVFDLDDCKWSEVKPKIGNLWPSQRSGFQMFVHQDEIFLYGGYFKSIVASASSNANSKKDVTEKSIVYNDIWKLNPLTWDWSKVKRLGNCPGPRAGFSICVNKKKAYFFGGVVDKEEKDLLKSTFLNEMFIFQMDNYRWYSFELKKQKEPKNKAKREKTNLSTKSEDAGESNLYGDDDDGNTNDNCDYDDYHYDDMENQIIDNDSNDDDDGFVEDDNIIKSKAEIKKEKKENRKKKKLSNGLSEEDGKINQDSAIGKNTKEKSEVENIFEEKLEENEKIEDGITRSKDTSPISHNSGDNILSNSEKDVTEKLQVISIDDSQKTNKEDDRIIPCGRINACVVVSNNIMYLYGGIMEINDKEITLDDFYSLDLNKHEEWNCILQATHSDWIEEVSEDDEDEEEEDDLVDSDEENSEEENFDNSQTEPNQSSTSTAVEIATKFLKGEGKKMTRKERKIKIESIRSELGLSDANITPLPGESLKEFFARTSIHWQKQAYEKTSKTGKELRKDGFDLCELRYKELRPVLDELERLESEQKAEEEEEMAKKKQLKPKHR